MQDVLVRKQRVLWLTVISEAIRDGNRGRPQGAGSLR